MNRIFHVSHSFATCQLNNYNNTKSRFSNQQNQHQETHTHIITEGKGLSQSHFRMAIQLQIQNLQWIKNTIANVCYKLQCSSTERS